MKVYIPVALQRQVRSQFHDACAYCQTAEHLTAMTFEFEHILPKAAGGETVAENLCLACPMCNRFKSDHAFGVEPETKLEVALFHPRRQLWSEHFRWNENGNEIVGLTAVGRATIESLRMNRPAMVRVRKMWVAMGEHPPRAES